jgi:hypothetical protein
MLPTPCAGTGCLQPFDSVALPCCPWWRGHMAGIAACCFSRLRRQSAPKVGERQGDPFGPLLFTLTLQGPLEVVAESNLAQPMAYADDLLSLPPCQLDTPKQKQGTGSPHPSPLKTTCKKDEMKMTELWRRRANGPGSAVHDDMCITHAGSQWKMRFCLLSLVAVLVLMVVLHFL